MPEPVWEVLQMHYPVPDMAQPPVLPVAETKPPETRV